MNEIWPVLWKLWLALGVLMFFVSWVAEGYPLARDEDDSSGEYVALCFLGVVFFLALWPVVLWWFLTDLRVRTSFLENLKSFFKKNGDSE